MTIDFTVICLFHGKDEVDSSALEGLIINAEVPSANLEHVQNVFGDILDILVHEVRHRLHLPITISVLLHKSLFNQNIDVEKLVLCCILFERIWYLFEPITNKDDNHVLLSHLNCRVEVHGVVVLQDSSNGHF